MPDNLTTQSIPHDSISLAENLRDRGYPIAGLPAAPRDDADEPDDPQQAELPTGPTHVAARRSPDQLASARTFIAAAGRVTFDRGRATLKAVWMAVAYYASLGAGPKRVCFAQVETLANRALVSERTVRRHLAVLAGHGLIQTDHRTGGHAPTHWDVSEFSPSVLGGQNGRAGRPEWPGSPDTVADDVSNRSSAPTEQKLLLASKQRPDGACAPPTAAQKHKKSPQQTKREQTTAQAKTDTGGVTRGASDKQIVFLQMLADRVGADHAEDLWRAADPKRLQAQIKAAKPFKDLNGKHKHTHEVDVEVALRIGIEDDERKGKTGYKSVVQRCECGAVRPVDIDIYGDLTGKEQWILAGYLVDYLVDFTTFIGPMTAAELSECNNDPDDAPAESLVGRWRDPMTWEEVSHLYKALPKSAGWSDDERLVPVDWTRVAAEAEKKARVAAEAKKKACDHHGCQGQGGGLDHPPRGREEGPGSG